MNMKAQTTLSDGQSVEVVLQITDLTTFVHAEPSSHIPTLTKEGRVLWVFKEDLTHMEVIQDGSQ